MLTYTAGMIITDEELLSRIEAFLERTGLAPTRFGREAMREASFIDSLRNGRSLSLRNANRVLNFMAEFEASEERDAIAETASAAAQHDTSIIQSGEKSNGTVGARA